MNMIGLIRKVFNSCPLPQLLAKDFGENMQANMTNQLLPEGEKAQSAGIYQYGSHIFPSAPSACILLQNYAAILVPQL